MTPALEVRHLRKVYPAFTLDDVSFSLEPGKITGFIGRNGAGKTTTLRAILGLIHPDGGEVRFFGETELDKVKQEIGFVSGGVSFYPSKKLRTITDVTRRFYPGWDDAAYRRYLGAFELREDKLVRELSEGMKVKYALALALSHRARLLLLDEPTSGLDPVSRDELMDIFLGLRDTGATILFSTHITSDLGRCADDLIYLRHGKIFAQDELGHFVNQYRLVELQDGEAADAGGLIGLRREKSGFTALRPASSPGGGKPADLESIMLHLEREDSDETSHL